MDSKEMAPGDIERRSFEIITEELGGRTVPAARRARREARHPHHC